MSIIDFFKKLFPFLVSAAEKTFDQLEDSAQIAGVNGSLFAQIIKENTEAGIADVENLIKARLGLSDGTAEELFKTLREKYNIPDDEQVVSFLQDKFKNATDDILHSSLANEVASLVAIVLSKGKLTWLTLLAGVGEYIYRKYVKGRDVQIKEEGGGGDHGCKPNEYWNGTQCVLKVGLNQNEQ